MAKQNTDIPVTEALQRRLQEHKAAQEALRRSEEQFRAMFEQAGVGMAQVGLDGRWLRVNDALCDIIGYSRAELLQRTVRDVTHPDDLQADLEYRRRTLAGEIRTCSMDKRYVRKDGVPVWVGVTVSLVRDDAGEPGYFIDVVEDIGARKQVEDEAYRLASVIEFSDDAIFSKNLEGIITGWNAGAEHLYGYSAREIKGQPVSILVPPERADEIPSILDRIRRGERVERHETVRLHKDGTPVQVSVTVSPSKDPEGRIVGAAVISHDITDQKEAKDLLRRSNELLETMFSSTQVMIAYLDRDFNFLRVNRAYADADEREPEFYVGKNHFDLFPNEENEAIFRKVVDTGEPYIAYAKPFVYAEHPERGVSYWDWRLHPVKDAQGKTEGLILNLLDVTEPTLARRQLQEASVYARTLIEASLDPFVTIGPDGTITDVNAATEAVTGYDRAALIGTDFSDYFTDPAAARAGYERVFREGAVRDYALEIRHRSGRVTPVLYNASVYRDAAGNVVGVFAAARDITARKRVEEALQRLNEQLEQRVAKRTAQLEAANRELEAFSYSVSHDLRAPLRAIDGFSQALLEDYGERLDEQGKGYLERVRAGAQRMGQLIDDLLKLSRLTRGELQRSPVDMSALAKAVGAELQRANPERQVDFIVQEGISAEADPRMLQVVLENLLSNAWKFTRKHSRARIEFGATRIGDKLAYFVRDDGAGFDMAYADKLFAPFQRLHAPHEFPGTGIGLAIVQRIIRRHGGTVWGEGAVDKGATFYFTLN